MYSNHPIYDLLTKDHAIRTVLDEVVKVAAITFHRDVSTSLSDGIVTSVSGTPNQEIKEYEGPLFQLGYKPHSHWMEDYTQSTPNTTQITGIIVTPDLVKEVQRALTDSN